MKTEDADPSEHVENKTKVAKYFEDEKTGKQRLFRGVVDGYKQKNKYWHITFEVLYVPTRVTSWSAAPFTFASYMYIRECVLKGRRRGGF